MKFLTLLVAAVSQVALAEAAPAQSMRDSLGPFVPMLVMFGIIYFLMIRPKQKEAKVHQAFLAGLKRGDMVVTNAGIIGTVRTVSDKLVTLEIDEGVCIKVLRPQIAHDASKINEDAKLKAAETKPKPV